MDELKKSYHAVVDRLEEYLQRNICTDPDSRYFGGLCENHRTIPVLDTWPHAVYPATDGYISLYGATGKRGGLALSGEGSPCPGVPPNSTAP